MIGTVCIVKMLKQQNNENIAIRIFAGLRCTWSLWKNVLKLKIFLIDETTEQRNSHFLFLWCRSKQWRRIRKKAWRRLLKQRWGLKNQIKSSLFSEEFNRIPTDFDGFAGFEMIFMNISRVLKDWVQILTAKDAQNCYSNQADKKSFHVLQKCNPSDNNS